MWAAKQNADSLIVMIIKKLYNPALWQTIFLIQLTAVNSYAIFNIYDFMDKILFW